jgi:Flp pilus assembly protein TadD
MALLLTMVDKSEEAIRHCQEVLRINPKNSRALSILRTASMKKRQVNRQEDQIKVSSP